MINSKLDYFLKMCVVEGCESKMNKSTIVQQTSVVNIAYIFHMVDIELHQHGIAPIFLKMY